MCHGSLEPKLMMREMDQRLSSVVWTADDKEAAARGPREGVFAKIRTVLATWTRKEARHG